MRSRLICYAPWRPEEEYRVSEGTKVLGRYSFFRTRFLKTLYLPRGIELEDKARYFNPDNSPKITYS